MVERVLATDSATMVPSVVKGPRTPVTTTLPSSVASVATVPDDWAEAVEEATARMASVSALKA